jgi:osmotically-inducible protein OsmY
LSDRHLAATIKVRLDTHRDIEITTSSVEVRAGVALLRGRVRTERHKRLAAGVAASVRGVRGVFNELRVDDTSAEDL